MRSLILLGALLVAACGPHGENVSADAEPAAEVVEIQTESVCERVRFEGSVLTRCTADPDIHRITLALKDADGRIYRTMPDFAARRGADAEPVVFAMNAGMYDEAGEPIGYYVEESERLQELNRNDGPGNFHLKPNGVFYIPEAGDWRIATSEDFYSSVTDRPLYGTQSGPMLVIDGELHPDFSEDGDSRKIRNAVGVDSAGQAHFVISEAPISFGKLARYYRDEVQAVDALFLDGTVSSLWDPSTDRMDIGPTLGPLVVVERKARQE